MKNSISSQYRPLSAWAYFGYGILFNLPVIGFILLIVLLILLMIIGINVSDIIDSSVTTV